MIVIHVFMYLIDAYKFAFETVYFVFGGKNERSKYVIRDS